MKIRDIVESRNLTEFAATDSTDLVDMLAQVLSNTDAADPIHQQANKVLDQLVAKAQAPAAPAQPAQPAQQQTPQPAPAQAPVTEAAGKLTAAEQAKIDLIKKMVGKNNKLEAVLSDPATARYIMALHEKSIEMGKDIQYQSSREWNDTLERTARELADKVVNNAEIIHNAIATNERKDAAVSEGLEEAKPQAKPKAGGDTGDVMKDKIVNLLRSIFEKPVRTQRDRAGTEEMGQAVTAFMVKCKKGIIDFNQVLNNTDPNAKIDDQVRDPKDRKIYDMIKHEVFDAQPGTTAGAWGPGEVGLAVLSNPVTKGTEGGDLRVMTPKGPVEVELKGMKNGTAGGRFNSKGIAKGTDAAAAFRKVAEEFVWKLIDIGNEDIDSSKYKPNTPQFGKVITKVFTKVKNQKTGATKVKKIETFDLEALRDIWNPMLVGPASIYDPKGTKKACIEFLTRTIECAILPEGMPYAKKAIAEMAKDPNLFYDRQVEGGFGLNWLGIQANFAKVLYAVYSGVDKKGVIMYFNTLTSNYYVAKGPEDVKKQIMAKKLRTGNAIIDFGAGQVPASMQVGID